MKILPLILGIVIGLMAITLVTELIEFTTVAILSGKSFADLSNDPQAYFAVRNRPGVLIFKIIYNFIAAIIGGYLTTWIAKSWAAIGVYLLIAIQTLLLVWAGFLSDLSTTGPVWMWIALIVITPIGIYAGYRLRGPGKWQVES
ncbi:MAG: hypothetical protein R3264_09805 [Anaerolineae bacterium]|nr:hypothetical protein [Anaerolineae bacterium]